VVASPEDASLYLAEFYAQGKAAESASMIVSIGDYQLAVWHEDEERVSFARAA